MVAVRCSDHQAFNDRNSEKQGGWVTLQCGCPRFYWYFVSRDTTVQRKDGKPKRTKIIPTHVKYTFIRLIDMIIGRIRHSKIIQQPWPYKQLKSLIFHVLSFLMNTFVCVFDLEQELTFWHCLHLHIHKYYNMMQQYPLRILSFNMS